MYTMIWVVRVFGRLLALLALPPRCLLVMLLRDLMTLALLLALMVMARCLLAMMLLALLAMPRCLLVTWVNDCPLSLTCLRTRGTHLLWVTSPILCLL